MALHMVPTDKVPERRRGPRRTACLEAVEAAQSSPSGIALIEGDLGEVTRLYKSLVQWRTRHADPPIGLRKDGSKLYVWLAEASLGAGES